MRRIYFLLFPAVVVLVWSCGNKSGNSPANAQQTLIVGKWNLQKQNSTVYVDGVQQLAVTKEASDKGFCYVQFEANDSYTSVNYYNSGGLGNTSLSSVISVDTVRGNYHFSGAIFNLSLPALAGFGDGLPVGVSGPPEAIHLVSQSEQIMQLTASVLTLHLEYTTTHSTETYTRTYKNVLDYYYTR